MLKKNNNNTLECKGLLKLGCKVYFFFLTFICLFTKSKYLSISLGYSIPFDRQRFNNLYSRHIQSVPYFNKPKIGILKNSLFYPYVIIRIQP